MVRASKKVVSKNEEVLLVPPTVEEPKQKKVKKVVKEEPVVVSKEPEPVLLKEEHEEPVALLAEKELVNEIVVPVSVKPSTELSPLLSKLNELEAQLQQFVSLVSSIKVNCKTIHREIIKTEKKAQKHSHKKKKDGNKAPSGFVKPTLISDELAGFLNLERGVKLARTEVSKHINQYIRQNNLQNKENGRFIIPDAKLSQLLKLNKEDELSYFNLQKYLKHHFFKEQVEPVV